MFEIKTPYLTVDAIVFYSNKIVLVNRKFEPYGLALPGGFVEYGESVEAAVRREIKEETNLDLEDLEQFKMYSDPSRDTRLHTCSMVFTAKGIGKLVAGDDAKEVELYEIDFVKNLELCFDHSKIIKDYLESL